MDIFVASILQTGSVGGHAAVWATVITLLVYVLILTWVQEVSHRKIDKQMENMRELYSEQAKVWSEDAKTVLLEVINKYNGLAGKIEELENKASKIEGVENKVNDFRSRVIVLEGNRVTNDVFLELDKKVARIDKLPLVSKVVHDWEFGSTMPQGNLFEEGEGEKK